MLQRLKELLVGAGADSGEPEQATFDETAFAVAALMSEAARQDGHFGDAEWPLAIDLLRKRFALDAADAKKLLSAADARISVTHQLLPFTRTLKDRLSEAERIEVVEMLWEVIYADGDVHDYEAGLMRRIAGLIYVQDVDMGAARKRVRARLELASDPDMDTDTP